MAQVTPEQAAKTFSYWAPDWLLTPVAATTLIFVAVIWFFWDYRWVEIISEDYMSHKLAKKARRLLKLLPPTERPPSSAGIGIFSGAKKSLPNANRPRVIITNPKISNIGGAGIYISGEVDAQIENPEISNTAKDGIIFNSEGDENEPKKS